MFDPFAGRHPPQPLDPLPLVGLRPVAPIRCPHCHRRLTSKNWPKGGADWYRWCKRCRCTVAYIYDEEMADA